MNDEITITIGDTFRYVGGLVLDNFSLLDAPIDNFVLQDKDGVEYVIRLEKL